MNKTFMLFFLVVSSLPIVAAERFSPVGISLEGSKEADVQYPTKIGSVYGYRLAFFTGAHRQMVGVATAGFSNNDEYADGYVGGLQVTSFYNTARDAELGVWQISGFHNMVTENCNGIQICAFYNRVAGWCTGMQIATCNMCMSDIAGAQIGVFNHGAAVSGMQIGMVNYAGKLRGVQVGLANFVDDSQMLLFPVLRIGW